MSYYDRALEMKDELVANRRYLHENAEVGLTLPKTRAFIEEKLREYGIEPQRCGEGVTGLIGKGGKVLLLRADMDALAMPEESGLPFASRIRRQRTAAVMTCTLLCFWVRRRCLKNMKAS